MELEQYAIAETNGSDLDLDDKSNDETDTNNDTNLTEVRHE